MDSEAVTACSVEGCPNPQKAKGYCGGHYTQLWQGRTLAPLRGWAREGSKGTCRVDGCVRPARSQRLCRAHGSTPSSRTRRIGNHGYALLYWPDHPNATAAGYVSEHVAVMVDAIGRPLHAGESVHHKNGDRLDNRLENLELWAKGQPAGQRVEDKVEWALDLLRRYAPEKLAPDV